ncbi:MAG: response regulator [Proteobacteria bacterium]|nr:response regulator [Pseudomonadota bacterium]
MKNIIVIDDDPVVRHILPSMLTNLGHKMQTFEVFAFEVFAFENAKTALEHLSSSAAPSLIFLDFQLPDLDSQSIIKAIRENLGHTTTPIILMSANQSEDFSTIFTSLSIQDFLEKPFTQERVVEYLNKWLKQ